jgi:predicted secreted protein
MNELRDEAEDVLDEAARGRAESTPVTVHLLVIVVIATVAVVVIAIVLGLYLAL